MALSFNPVNVSLPTPPSYAAPAMGAPVDSNPLSTLGELTNIQATRQNIATSEQALKKAKTTFGSDVARNKAESEKAVIETELKGMEASTKKQQAIGAGFISQIYNPLVQKAAKDPSLLTADERKKLVDDTMEWGMRQGAEAGVDKATTARLVQPYLDIAQKNPEQLGDYLKSRHILSLSPETRTAATTPSGIPVNTGAGGYTAATNPYAGVPQGQPIPGTQFTQQLPPTTEAVAQPGDNSGLPPGTKYPIGGTGGNQPVNPAVPTQPVGVTPEQMKLPSNAQKPVVTALSPQVSENMKIGNALVNNAREVAGTASNIEFAANQAIQLAEATDVGKGSEIWNTLKGRGVLLPDFDYKNPAANYDKLGHVLAQQNALLAANPAVSSAMTEGAVTNKKLDLGSQVSGTTNWTKEGIQYASRTNRALADMIKLYTHGLNQSQVISNDNPLKANEFKDKWNSVVDIDSIRLANAKRYEKSDPQGLKEIVKELGGQDSDRYKKVQLKLKIINDLAARGK
jgi:hypothetical protein